MTRFGEISPLWQSFEGLWQLVKSLLSIWQYYNLLLQISCTIELVFIAVNGQITKKQSSSLVSLLHKSNVVLNWVVILSGKGWSRSGPWTTWTSSTWCRGSTAGLSTGTSWGRSTSRKRRKRQLRRLHRRETMLTIHAPILKGKITYFLWDFRMIEERTETLGRSFKEAMLNFVELWLTLTNFPPIRMPKYQCSVNLW